jgi:hypothetical protein
VIEVIDDFWSSVELAHYWLDAHKPAFGDRIQWRIGKISEEMGEVQAALIGAARANPRKTPADAADRWANVAAELCDVIITAAVALRALPDYEVSSAREALRRRLHLINERITWCPPAPTSALADAETG